VVQRTLEVTIETSAVIESATRGRLHKLYDQMWQPAIRKIRADEIERDPILAAGGMDRRRGLTLIARPSAFTRKRVNELLRALRRLEPDQYYYASTDFHLTVLSLFTATADPEPFVARTGQYVSALDAALRQSLPSTSNLPESPLPRLRY